MWGPGQGSHQLCTSCTEGVLSTLSGSRFISFMMLARRTGSSCLRKVNEVFSQALLDPGGKERMREVSPHSCKPWKLEDISGVRLIKSSISRGFREVTEGTEEAAFPMPCSVLTSLPAHLTLWGVASSPHPQLNPVFLQQ